MNGMTAKAPQALHGIRVLEIGQGFSAPYCTRNLASFGAEVIKVEPPACGDPFRQLGPFLDHTPNAETSAPFLYLNTGKKGITLDLESEVGVETFKRLVEKADVLVEDLPPGRMGDMGLAYETLETLNPGLVMASITGFGQSGPYRDYKSNSMISYAVTGLMYMNGEPRREPLTGSGHIPEYEAAVHAYNAICAALFWREETGEGQFIDISVMEAMAYFHEFAIVVWTHVGILNERAGNRHPVGIHPLSLYPCKDGYVSISVATPDQYDNLMLLIERPDLLDEPRYADRHERWNLADEFDEILLPWLMEHTADEIVRRAQELRIPSGRLNNCGQLITDPQLAARDFWMHVEHPHAGRQTYPGAPFKMSETPYQLARAPLLGEHNHDVYVRDLGLSPDDMDQLSQAGVI